MSTERAPSPQLAPGSGGWIGVMWVDAGYSRVCGEIDTLADETKIPRRKGEGQMITSGSPTRLLTSRRVRD